MPWDVIDDMRAECTTELVKVNARREKLKRQRQKAVLRKLEDQLREGDDRNQGGNRFEMSTQGAKNLFDQVGATIKDRFFGDKQEKGGAGYVPPWRGGSGRPMLRKGM